MTDGALDSSSKSAVDDHKVKVLYVAGWGRSGSTILGRILGQVSSFFLVGELRYIWDRGLIENRLCSCGAPFRKCRVWRQILSQVYANDGHMDVQKLVSLRDRELRTRHLLTPTLKNLQRRLDRIDEYQKTLEELYRAVQNVTQSKVLVDTSKFPSYGYVLRNTPGIELYVLHLVRDPRGVAYSWGSRRKLRMDHRARADKLMSPHGLVESSLVWDEWNLAVENVWRRQEQRYMLLRYEDFVNSPRSYVRDILRFMGEDEVESPFSGEREIALEVPHIFSGNPDRFQSGTITIKPDERWKEDMSGFRQAIVTTLTWPGLVRYKYPIWSRRQRPADAPQNSRVP